MSLLINPLRTEDSRYIPFDFAGQLPAGVTISSSACVCTVISGTDANPSDLIDSTSINSTIVKVYKAADEGVEGVIYNLSVRATGSDSLVYEMSGTLAIIP